MHNPTQNWEITPHHSLSKLNLRSAWEYRDLLALLVRRDFVTVYKQTILGPLWFFIQPLFTTVIFTFVFGKVAGISTDGLPGPLFYIAGITIWNYFSECVLKASSAFKDNADLFGKVYFPRIIMPLSIVLGNLVRFGIQMLLFILMLFYYKFTNVTVQPNLYLFLFPFLIIIVILVSLGAGMITSALTTRYRDLSFLLTFGIQLLMYTTPVIFPLSAAPSKYRWIIGLNPITHVLEAFRYGFLGKGSFSWSSLGYSAVFSIVIVIIGTVIFNKVEQNFVDTV